jgi:hypothetical protein
VVSILWHVCPLLGNYSINKPAISTQPTIEYTHCYTMPPIHAHNNRKDVAIGVFYGSTSRLYNEKPTIMDSSVGSQNSSSGVPNQKKMIVCQTDRTRNDSRKCGSTGHSGKFCHHRLRNREKGWWWYSWMDWHLKKGEPGAVVEKSL